MSKQDPYRCIVVFPDGHKAVGHVTGLKLDWPRLSIKVHDAHLSIEIRPGLVQRILETDNYTVQL